MNAKRKQAEMLIIKGFEAIDSTGKNANFFKEMFAKMSDEQFMNFCKRRYPFRLQQSVFKVEITYDSVLKALKTINVPAMETVTLPKVYTDSENGPVMSNYKALVIYCSLKKLKQFVTKKSGYNIDINKRNPKTGAIIDNGKGVESDRELETLAIQGMEKCMEEFSRAKADDMEAKNKMYTQINTSGQVYLKDIKSSNPSSQVSRSTVDVYLIASGLMSNLINKDYMTPYTMEMRKKRIEKR